MGIVIKQSGWNLASTVLGFSLGALNALYLGPQFLGDTYYGLMGYVLSTAFLLFPLMSFGIHNTIVKFYSRFTDQKSRDEFLTQMLLWPVLMIALLALVVYVFYDPIRLFIASKNQITSDFVWAIFLIAVFQAYFEIFYAWTKVHMKTVGGNFLKEVFYRATASVLLILVAFEIITPVQFIYSLVVIYAIRALLMKWLAFTTYMPKLRIGKWYGTKDLLHYSLLMIIAGSVGTSMLDLDKLMLNQLMIIDNIAWYNVAVFIATVIAVPARVVAQITHPLTAGYFNRKEISEVENLYKRSSLNLALISGFVMVIIICNVNEFYDLMPPEFAVGIPIVFLIAVVKFSENLLGSNNAILYNSDLYRVTLWLGLLLVIVAIVLNVWLIPEYGLIGAAVATCVAYVVYAFAKAYYVYHKLSIHPWTATTWHSLALIVLSIGVFYCWDFSWHPIVNIGLKSILITIFYWFTLRYFNLSTEITGLFKKYLK